MQKHGWWSRVLERYREHPTRFTADIIVLVIVIVNFLGFITTLIPWQVFAIILIICWLYTSVVRTAIK